MANFIKIIVLLIGFIFPIYSFSLNENNEKEIKTYYNEAEWYFRYGDYESASRIFKELLLVKNNSNYHYKLGVSLLFSYNNNVLKQAEEHLSRAVENTNVNYKSKYNQTFAPIDAYMYYGDVLRYNYKFSEAIEAYNKFLELSDKKNEFVDYINREINNCKTAQRLLFGNNRLTKVEIGPVVKSNKKHKTFPLISLDKTVSVFAYGERNVDFGNIEYDEMIECYKTDSIYFSQDTDEGWTKPINITEDLGIKHQAYPVSLSTDGNTLFIVQDDRDNGNIYVSYFVDNKWTKMKKLNGNINSSAWETHASISYDGKILYFTSNREGGYGGFDIYYSKLQGDSTWGDAVNLGSDINTKYNEDFPCIAADNTQLYFCSQGHENIGGYDVFKSIKKGDVYTDIENIGGIINTPRNDLFTISSDDNGITFTSLEKSASFLLDEIKTDTVETIASTDSIIQESSSIFENELVFIENELVVVEEGIIVEKGITDGSVYLIFDYNKSELGLHSKENLDMIVENNSEKLIKITAYADENGTQDYNLKLSKDRAISVKKYLINKGLPEKNIDINFLGETDKFGTDSLNRRVVIDIQLKN